MKVIQNLKRLLAVALCLTIFFSTSVSSYAQTKEITVSPRYSKIAYGSVLLSVGDGNAHIEADLEGKSGVTESYIKCNLEKLTGSTYWMQIKSFSKTGDRTVYLYEDYAIEQGTYRVMCTLRCDTETATLYSANETY